MTPLLFGGVLIAGAIGALARYLVVRAFGNRSGVPLGVLLVNVVGSGIGGVVLALAARGGVPPELQLVILSGFCGGLTTFSTWSVDSIQLVQDGKARLALASVAGNLVLGIAAAALGFVLVSTLP